MRSKTWDLSLVLQIATKYNCSVDSGGETVLRNSNLTLLPQPVSTQCHPTARVLFHQHYLLLCKTIEWQQPCCSESQTEKIFQDQGQFFRKSGRTHCPSLTFSSSIVFIQITCGSRNEDAKDSTAGSITDYSVTLSFLINKMQVNIVFTQDCCKNYIGYLKTQPQYLVQSRHSISVITTIVITGIILLIMITSGSRNLGSTDMHQEIPSEGRR